MYNGTEHLVVNGADINFSLLDFWQWGYSNLLQNMQRGTFAEFIVHCALVSGGVHTLPERITTTQPYDLDGPIIQSNGKPSRLEVKSASFVQLWDIKHPDRASFSIAPAIAPDHTGDYPDGAPKQRNNDIYIFSVYTATNRDCNILDLSWWEFYVVPTYRIDTDSRLQSQKTISLTSVKNLTNPVDYSGLCGTIKAACAEIPAEYERYSEPSKKWLDDATKPPCLLQSGFVIALFSRCINPGRKNHRH